MVTLNRTLPIWPLVASHIMIMRMPKVCQYRKLDLIVVSLNKLSSISSQQKVYLSHPFKTTLFSSQETGLLNSSWKPHLTGLVYVFLHTRIIKPILK